MDNIIISLGGAGEFIDWLTRIGFISGILAWVARILSKRAFRNTLINFYQSKNVTVMLPLRKCEGKQMLSESDYIAANTFDKFLSRYGLTVKIDFIYPDHRFDFLEGGKIVICGPKTSEIVKHSMDMQKKLKFIDNEGQWVLENKEKKIRYLSPMDDDKPGADISYFARASATGDYSNSFISIAGLHAEGSSIAAHYLCNKKNIRYIQRQSKESLFTAVVSGRYNISTKQPYSSKLEEINVDDHMLDEGYYRIIEEY